MNYNLIAQNINTIPDSLYDTKITCPAYHENKGPIVYLDEGHYNLHTFGRIGGFIAFKNVLRKDGYQVLPFKDQFTHNSLQNVRLLVISCAQNRRNLWPRWYNPTYTAFKRSEEIALMNWVKNGGSLFLIVDHHPIAGAAKGLARKFGVELYNGHALDTNRYPSYFHRANETLHSNVITNGRDITEKVDSIISFAGSAMKLSHEVSPILTFDDNWLQWLPDIAWNFNNIDPEFILGLSQGAFMEFGEGKFVIFGDSNMFSAQEDEYGIKGFIDPNAKYNHKLLLNIIHYLDGLLDYK